MLGFFFLISSFIAYMVRFEREALQEEHNNAALGLAQSLSVSSRSWVLANDVAGLQEVVSSFGIYPELRHAMILALDGRVMAHSDAGKTGLFLTDTTSRMLIQTQAETHILVNSETLVDVAVPVQAGERHVGWARIALERDRISADMAKTKLRATLFVLISSALALLAGTLIANRLAGRIASLARVADSVQNGDFSVRAVAQESNDEVSRLADSFNRMLDVLEKNAQDQRTASRYSRSLIEANLDPLATISPDGRITDINHAFEKVTGKSRGELIGTNFGEHFTEPDKAREVYRQALQKKKITDYPLAMLHKSGKVTDVLYNAGIFRNDAGETLGVLAAARDITERKQTEERIRHMAQYDALTDLPNRSLFSDRVNQALLHAQRNQKKLAIMFLDLDKFKPINDNYGHEVGDRVLKVVARRLQESVRRSDSVGRIGGDEFTILLQDVESEEAALQVARKIHRCVTQPLIVDGDSLQILASIGVAMYPDHGENEIDLARHADYAMYYAKDGKREKVQAYRPYMDEA